jgi:TonB family protein
MRAGTIFILLACVVPLAAQADAASAAAAPYPPFVIARLQCGGPAPLAPQAGGLTVLYPRESIKAHEQGQVLVSYDILPDGTVEDVQIQQSSGYPRLDAAAQSAVAGWHFEPRHTLGRNFELQHITFTLAANAPPSAKPADSCYPPPAIVNTARPIPIGPLLVQYPQDAIDAGEEGETTVTITVLPDGSVTNPSVSQSSGFSDLDQAAIDSVKDWHYRPIAKEVTFAVKLKFAKSLVQHPTAAE